MPGSWTSPDRPGARANALVRVAFRGGKRVGVRDYRTFAAQWLACTIPCRRFADTLAGAAARLGADVDRYSFIVVDSHHLLLAGLPGAHRTIPHCWAFCPPLGSTKSPRMPVDTTSPAPCLVLPVKTLPSAMFSPLPRQAPAGLRALTFLSEPV